jgi:hypothetical protein
MFFFYSPFVDRALDQVIKTIKKKDKLINELYSLVKVVDGLKLLLLLLLFVKEVLLRVMMKLRKMIMRMLKKRRRKRLMRAMSHPFTRN